MKYHVHSACLKTQPEQMVIIIFMVIVSWSQLIPAGKSQLLPLIPNSAFAAIVTNLKLATVEVFTPW